MLRGRRGVESSNIWDVGLQNKPVRMRSIGSGGFCFAAGAVDPIESNCRRFVRARNGRTPPAGFEFSQVII